MWLASSEEKVSEWRNSCRRSSGVGIGWWDMTIALLICRRSRFTLISSVDHRFAVMTMLETYVPASSGPCSGPSMMSFSASLKVLLVLWAEVERDGPWWLDVWSCIRLEGYVYHLVFGPPDPLKHMAMFVEDRLYLCL